VSLHNVWSGCGVPRHCHGPKQLLAERFRVPGGSANFRPGSNPSNVSLMIRDPYFAKAFKAAEDDGLAPSMATTDRPHMLNGGAAERVLETVEA
jgi:hypothetical protein